MNRTVCCAPPTPIEIGLNPELALVALLQQTIDMTSRALLAAHPELAESEFPDWFSKMPSTVVAQFLIRHLEGLAELLPQYRTAVICDWNPKKPPAPSSPPAPF